MIYFLLFTCISFTNALLYTNQSLKWSFDSDESADPVETILIPDRTQKCTLIDILCFYKCEDNIEKLGFLNKKMVAFK